MNELRLIASGVIIITLTNSLQRICLKGFFTNWLITLSLDRQFYNKGGTFALFAPW